MFYFRLGASMPLVTRATALFGVRHPIVQTGMGWVAGARLVAATAEAGGLGILAAATMTYEQLEGQVAEVKARTSQPFGVNLRADQEDFEKRVDLLIREGVRVASFARAPGKAGIRTLKDAGVVCMPTIGMVKHAKKVADWGVDAVIAQGGEGGGHTGSVPTSLLLPGVVEAVGDQVVVLGAGGFSTGRGLAAALAWGADGVAMGTRFLLTQESTVPEEVKARYLTAGILDTVVTRAVDGYPQRVVRTTFIDRLEASGVVGRLLAAVRHALAFSSMTGTSLFQLLQEGRAMRQNSPLTWPQVLMGANAPMYTKAALVDGRVDSGVLPTGQVVGAIDALPTVADLMADLVYEAESVLAGLPRHVQEPVN
jgi:NAD(P)H-dependent flavin oxidoreductase YrpB (nitropropane dioxygenase family)